MSLIKLSSMEEYQDLMKMKNEVIIFKNSTTCPISHAAFEDYSKLASETDEQLFYLNVQELREVSNKVADMFSVKHESPQVLFIQNQKVTWHASHRSITYTSLKEALNK